ncbi:MAG: 4-nitrophenylphosphatase [uncultured Propionibacteriaceae bacterium]|uniref:4-nitrophenylphosphatase n=1 Tax=uncultured Propionibacteriaceae bacterium TaxID=257457 RepID=A0A6J4P800_9ACTN|nr:MAG: 4-nitrophenylphosphatase [uncultured Propionibacteriaceae bacterium]
MTANPTTAPAALLVDGYDAALFDLDGVVYLGPIAVPHAAVGINALRRRGVRMGFVTNNAARPPAAVAEHLVELGISCTDSDVVTSAQAAARLLVDRFGSGAKVLMIGGAGVVEALQEAGLVGVRSADDNPAAVIQGWGKDLAWEHLNEAAIAIQRGAYWVATNTDTTRPTDRGIVPGNGAAVTAVRTAVDVDPEVAGKPYRPLMEETVHRLGARHPIFVGDRLDTDIAGAVTVGMDSLFVLSGAHGAAELLAAGDDCRPTHIGLHLGALLNPPREVSWLVNRVTCNTMAAVAAHGQIRLERKPADAEEAVDALWAVTQLVWQARDRRCLIDPSPAVELLTALP